MTTHQTTLPYTAEDAYVDWAFTTLLAATGDPVQEEARFRVAILAHRREIQALAQLCRKTPVWQMQGERGAQRLMATCREAEQDEPWFAAFRSLVITASKAFRGEIPKNAPFIGLRLVLPVIAELMNLGPCIPDRAAAPAVPERATFQNVQFGPTEKQVIADFKSLGSVLFDDVEDPASVARLILANREAVLNLARESRATWPWVTAGAYSELAMRARFNAKIPEAPWVAGFVSIAETLMLVNEGNAKEDTGTYGILITLPVIGDLLEAGTEDIHRHAVTTGLEGAPRLH